MPFSAIRHSVGLANRLEFFDKPHKVFPRSESKMLGTRRIEFAANVLQHSRFTYCLPFLAFAIRIVFHSPERCFEQNTLASKNKYEYVNIWVRCTCFTCRLSITQLNGAEYALFAQLASRIFFRQTTLFAAAHMRSRMPHILMPTHDTKLK